jgi:hypothetical protein
MMDGRSSTVAAVSKAYYSAYRNFAKLNHEHFVALLSSLADLPPGLTLAETLFDAASDGSIEAAAALNLLASDDPSLGSIATDGLKALFRRNCAACDELASEGLILMLARGGEDIGPVCNIDAMTGQRNWRDG